MSPGARPSAAPAAAPSEVLLAERQGVAFVASAEAAGGLQVPRRYWDTEIGVVAIPASDDEVRAAELQPLGEAGSWPRVQPRPDRLWPALTRMLSRESSEMSLFPGRDGIKASLQAPDGSRHPFPIAPKDALGVLAAVLQHAPRGVVAAAAGVRPERLLLAVCPGTRPREYRLRIAGAVTSPPPTDLAGLGISSSLLEILRETLERPSGLLLAAGGSASGISTTLDLLARSLLERGRRGGRIGPRPGGPAGPLPWISEAVTDWPFPESLREVAPDFVVLERLEGVRHLRLAARLAATGTLVLAGATPADPQALVRRVRQDLEAAGIPDVPIMALAQALVRTVCRACAVRTQLPAARALRLGFHRWDLEEMGRRGGLSIPAGRGCSECAGTGLAGLTGVFGFASSDGAASALPSVREDGWRKVLEGAASVEDVLTLAGAHTMMRPMREVTVLAGLSPAAAAAAQDATRPAAPAAAGAGAPAGAPAMAAGSAEAEADDLARLLRATPPQPARLRDLARAIAGRAQEGDLARLLAEHGQTLHPERHAINTALIAARIAGALGLAEDAPATALLALARAAGAADLGAELALGVAAVQALLDDPTPVARDRADVRAQAVALADVVDRAHHAGRARGVDLPAVSSECMASHGKRFSPFLFRGLLRAIPIFPVGCLVELSSGDRARVVAQNDDNHFRPRVEIGDGRDPAAARRVVDLARSPFLHIRHRLAAAEEARR